jgi:hypothetical protein
MENKMNDTELNIMSILRLANIKLELVSLGEMFDPAEGVLVTTTDVGNDMVISRVLDNNLSGAIEQALHGTVRHWRNYGNDVFFVGLLSAYNENPTNYTVRHYQEYNMLPQGDIDSEYILMAVNNCDLLGETGTLFIDGERQEQHVMFFDCLGGNGIHSWMSEGNADTPWKISGELGWNDWQEHPDWVHSGKMATIWYGPGYGEWEAQIEQP